MMPPVLFVNHVLPENKTHADLSERNDAVPKPVKAPPAKLLPSGAKPRVSPSMGVAACMVGFQLVQKHQKEKSVHWPLLSWGGK